MKEFLATWWEVLVVIGGACMGLLAAAHRLIRGHMKLHEALDRRVDRIETHCTHHCATAAKEFKEIRESQEKLEALAEGTQVNVREVLVHLKLRKPGEH
jgi:hypothetical protein